MAVLTFPSGDSTAPPTMSIDRAADVATEIATHLGSIERLASMLACCGNVPDSGALVMAIESLAKRAAAMADLLVVAHGSAPVRGDFNAWCGPESLTAQARD
jgi:hypothetical protein